ncbi:PP2C family serine/threonine-protein phosphatase [Pseudomonas poae]|nr:PP2C family serine/threonine-protein phosphatase [Pseudomonas poae]
MTSTVLDYRALTACAFIAGSSHAKTQTPCQDFVAARRVKGITCIALADGAGSRSRSEEGAKVVVNTMLAYICRHFETLWKMAENNPVTAAEEVISRCMKALQLKAVELECNADDLASTLLFVAHSHGRYLAAHLGDGLIAMVDSEGQAHVLSLPDNGEFTNTTVFVTDPRAVPRLRIYCGLTQDHAGFMIMSDGAAESLYQKVTTTPAPAIKKLLEWNIRLPRKKMKAVLEGNLGDSIASKTSDDCAVGLLSVLRQTQ